MLLLLLLMLTAIQVGTARPRTGAVVGLVARIVPVAAVVVLAMDKVAQAHAEDAGDDIMCIVYMVYSMIVYIYYGVRDAFATMSAISFAN